MNVQAELGESMPCSGKKKKKGELDLSLFVQWHVKPVTLCENMQN